MQILSIVMKRAREGNIFALHLNTLITIYVLFVELYHNVCNTNPHLAKLAEWTR